MSSVWSMVWSVSVALSRAAWRRGNTVLCRYYGPSPVVGRHHRGYGGDRQRGLRISTATASSTVLWRQHGHVVGCDHSVSRRTTALPPFFIRTLPDPHNELVLMVGGQAVPDVSPHASCVCTHSYTLYRYAHGYSRGIARLCPTHASVDTACPARTWSHHRAVWLSA